VSSPSAALLVEEPLPPRAAPAPRSFFLGPTARVAQDLLGAVLLRRHAGRTYGARIVEVEAYLGVRDPAAHSHGGRRTARVEPMYAVGGHLYVFLVYGMHRCANLVTRAEGVPEAVLLRAAAPLAAGADPGLLAGPGKLCRALGIDLDHSGLDLLGPSSPLSVHLDPVPRRRRTASPRIGIDYAGEAAAWPLRFFVADSPSVSRRPRGAGP
jgi:DNA-3-methyladenine glycosylase